MRIRAIVRLPLLVFPLALFFLATLSCCLLWRDTRVSRWEPYDTNIYGFLPHSSSPGQSRFPGVTEASVWSANVAQHNVASATCCITIAKDVCDCVLSARLMTTVNMRPTASRKGTSVVR